MMKTGRKWLSVVLAAGLLFSQMPVNVVTAAENENPARLEASESPVAVSEEAAAVQVEAAVAAEEAAVAEEAVAVEAAEEAAVAVEEAAEAAEKTSAAQESAASVSDTVDESAERADLVGAEVTGVKFTYNCTSLRCGDSYTLKVTFTPDTDITVPDVTFTSSNEAVATVTQGGVVTAGRIGSAAITLSAMNGKFTDTFYLTVADKVWSTDPNQDPYLVAHMETPPDQYTVRGKLDNFRETLFPEGTPYHNGYVYMYRLSQTGVLYQPFGCVGLAHLISNDIFGDLPEREISPKSAADIRVGDMLVIGGGYYCIVTDVDDSTVTYGEFEVSRNGGPSAIHWGSTLPISTVTNGNYKIVTRYPENYEEPTHVHDFDDPTGSLKINVVSPTCTEPGYEEYECYCGVTKRVEGSEVPALGHEYGEWKVVTAATATKDGEERRYCIRDCGAYESRPIPATGPSQDERTGECGMKLNWRLANGLLTITGTGTMYAQDKLGFREYLGEILEVRFEEGATSISADAFADFTEMKTLTLPTTLTTIGAGAFDGCDALEAVTIPAKVTSIGKRVFASCDALQSVTLPDSLKTIGVQAFSYCESLASITIPGTVTSIGQQAFESCDSLQSVTIPDSVKTIGAQAFVFCGGLESVVISKVATTIGKQAFAACDEIKTIHVPASVTSIGAYAFDKMDGLMEITVDEANTKYASQDGMLFTKNLATLIQVPGGMEEAVIPEGTKTIQSLAAVTTNLEKLVIPASVTTITDKAVGYYYSMWSIDEYELDKSSWIKIYGYAGTRAESYAKSKELPFVAMLPDPSSGKIGDNVTYELKNHVLTISGNGETWDYDSSDNPSPFYLDETITTLIVQEGVTVLGKGLFREMKTLESVTLPSSLTTLRWGVFNSCAALKSIRIPDKVTTIDGMNFYYCESLETISLPAGLKSLGSDCFYNCISLKSLEIPDGVVRLPYNLCQNCKSLASVSLPENLRAIDWNVFSSCESLAEITFPTKNNISLTTGIFYETALTDVTIPANVIAIGERSFGYHYGSGMEKVEGFTIRGYEGSAAETYAKENGFVFISLGKAQDQGEIFTGTCGNTAVWEISGGVLTISGTGSTGYWWNQRGPWAKYADKFSKIVIEEGITEIGEQSFEYLPYKEVVLPESLVTIASGAFEGAENLKELTIPAGVKSIGSLAFMDAGITSLTVLGKDTEMMGSSYGITWGIGGWNLTGGTEIYGISGSPAEEYAKEYDMPFHPINGGASLIASGSCGANAKWAYRDDGTLTISGTGAMTDYSSVLNMPWKEYANEIKHIVIEEGITRVGNGTFGRCDNAETIKLPTTLTSIGFMAFYYLSKVTELKLPTNLTSIEGYAFQGSGVKTLVIPEKVKTIGGQAFSNCEQLTALTLPTSMESIGGSAFSDCNLLKTVSIPSGLKDISSPFYGCKALKTVYIPKSVTRISANSFGSWSSLADVYYEGSSAEWKKITVETNNTALSRARIHYGASDPNGMPFNDVKTSAYYATPVMWAVQNGITGGTSSTTFSPNDACTRAQVVTFLWRAAGSPAPKTTKNPFKDVSSGKYYYKAVLWAAENNITSGTSATAFSPDKACTRAQVVTFLYRAAGSPVVSGTTGFTDVKQGAYYEKPVIWAVKSGITSGTSKTTFSPDQTCIRGQIVTFLYRA